MRELNHMEVMKALIETGAFIERVVTNDNTSWQHLIAKIEGETMLRFKVKESDFETLRNEQFIIFESDRFMGEWVIQTWVYWEGSKHHDAII